MDTSPKKEHSLELTPGMTAEELLAAVEANGRSLRIVRAGKAVARIERLEPGEDSFDRESLAEVATRLEELSLRQTLGPGVTLRDLIDEGRE